MKKLVGLFVALVFCMSADYAFGYNYWQCMMIKQTVLSTRNSADTAATSCNAAGETAYAEYQEWDASRVYHDGRATCTAENHPNCGGETSCCVEDWDICMGAGDCGNAAYTVAENYSQDGQHAFDAGDVELYAGDDDMDHELWDNAFQHYVNAGIKFSDAKELWQGATSLHNDATTHWDHGNTHFGYIDNRHPFEL